jgi:lipid-binding SYLF domain-containing protein
MFYSIPNQGDHLMYRSLTRFVALVAVLAVIGVLAGCSTAPKTESKRNMLKAEADLTLKGFKEADPQLSGFFKTAKAYAVFPSVGKGGVGVGGAYGRGVLYEGGVAVGYCDLSQGSIGFQLGGQVYSELIFFQTDYALENFKGGEFAFAAQASAVAATAGAAANVDYDGGVAVFTHAKGGLMYEASIGGQKFSYQPK